MKVELREVKLSLSSELKCYDDCMELFMFMLYAFSILGFYLSIQSDDSEYEQEDSGEFNLIDSI
jgi:hypothetical protein